MTIEPLPALARRHSWGEPKTIDPEGSHNGCELHERRCALCGMVKITVLPPHGFPWREWRTFDGKLWQGAATPPCLDRVAA